MLSFIFLCDGPSDSHSFRPENDSSAWWGRRDSLTRICNLSLFAGSPNVCSDICFLFAPQEGKKEEGKKRKLMAISDSSISKGGADDFERNVEKEYSAMIMRGGVDSLLSRKPTERNLTSIWKEACLSSSSSSSAALKTQSNTQKEGKFAQKGFSFGLSSSSSNSGSNNTKASNPNQASSSSGSITLFPRNAGEFVLYVRRPSEEALLLPHNKVNTSSSSSSSSSSHTARQAIADSSLDKRKMLAYLQATCPIPFLKEVGLLGKPDLVLKKKNRADVMKAHQLWQQQETGTGGNATNATASDPSLAVHKSRLQLAFEVLFSRRIRTARAEAEALSKKDGKRRNVRCSILVLHEDCEEELPVFGGIEKNTSSDKSQEEEEEEVHIVFAVLGAVRDAEAWELAACGHAAKAVGASMSGAHLGQTVEFTSKISAALCGHELVGRLGPAMKALQSGAGAGRGLVTRDKDKSDSGDTSHLSTLTPSISVPVPIPVLRMHFCVWLDIDVAAVLHEGSLGMDRRERMLPLIQCVVCCLWRSRLVRDLGKEKEKDKEKDKLKGKEKGEKDKDEGEEAEEESAGGGRGGIEPLLHFVFTCGRTATVTREGVALKMAELHWAAPTELQVLTAVREVLLLQQQEEEDESGNDKKKNESEKGLLKRLMKRWGDKGAAVLDVTGLCGDGDIDGEDGGGIPCTDIDIDINIDSDSDSKSETNSGPSIADRVYAEMCLCGGANKGQEKVNQVKLEKSMYFLLRPPGSRAGRAKDNVTSRPLKRGVNRARLFPTSTSTSIKNKDISTHTRGGRGRGVNREVNNVTPAYAITMLQHWAGHGRVQVKGMWDSDSATKGEVVEKREKEDSRKDSKKEKKRKRKIKEADL